MKARAKVRVKICGITNLRDALRATALGATWLGFNFYEGSPRCIAPAKAHRIIQRLPRRVRAVGVFVDASLAHVADVAKQVRLHAVQLHGDESPRTVAQLAKRFRVWKAVRVRPDFRPTQLRKFRDAECILLDAFSRKAMGGTGRTFDWELARKAKRYARIILAGGLTPENVASAIGAARPYAVDVASGVEKSPGTKSARKMRAFMQAVKAV